MSAPHKSEDQVAYEKWLAALRARPALAGMTLEADDHDLEWILYLIVFRWAIARQDSLDAVEACLLELERKLEQVRKHARLP